MVHFPKPGKKQRRLLWEKLFADTFELEERISLDDLSDKYELSGGEMINVLRYCALSAAKRKERIIELNDIVIGVRREYSKSNKTI
jgi:ATP-dependent 26S proteasome regulatory subunit